MQILIWRYMCPKNKISQIYPKEEFKQTKFISNLTGYIETDNYNNIFTKLSPSKREIMSVIRKPLPMRYGQLGLIKKDW